MDMSKLPRLSQTQEPPPAASPDPAVDAAPPRSGPALDYAAPNESVAAEAWISIAIGVIILLVAPRLIQYVLSPSTFGEKWTFSDASGAPLAYAKTVFFWGDVAMTLFALVLIVEGLVLAVGRKLGAVMFAFGLTLLAVLANVAYVVMAMQMNFGLQIMSAFAVAFGGYIAFYQWGVIQSLRRRSASVR